MHIRCSLYRGLLFMYFTYLFTFITFVNEDVGGFVHWG